MASIRLTQFAGLMPQLSAKLKRKDNAQIAHNCLLYDGRLRAMPAYFRYQQLSQAPLSLYRAFNFPPFNTPGDVVPDFDFTNALYFDGPPFPTGAAGIYESSDAAYTTYVAVKFGQPGITGNILPAGIGPLVASAPATFSVTPMNQSRRPTVVGYAITALRINGNNIEETPPLYLGTIGNTSPLYYDGDAVHLSVALQPLTCGETAVRIYRTITAIETGEQLVNTFDTDWYLVDTVSIDPTAPIVTYVDISVSQNLKGTLLLTEGFLPPFFRNAPMNFGVSESGWLWFSTNNEVQFSERYRWHAWSIPGYLKLPTVDKITSVATYYDTMFIGTTSHPYKAKVAYNDVEGNDDPMMVSTNPYPEVQPCIANTLVRAPFGALYTSPNGVISLDENRMQVITKDLLNDGDVIYSRCVAGVHQDFSYEDITQAAWFNGWYIGYGNGIAFVYDTPEDLNSVHPFQQLITMDLPTDVPPQCWVVGGLGLHTAFGSNLYYWPVPGWVRKGDTPQKLCYQWKSKKFVMPGITNFAAAKVVHECDGEVCFNFIVDCRCVFSTKVTDCQPFRLPSSIGGIEFEIELIGKGTVSEVHVASSMQNLTEVETE